MSNSPSDHFWNSEEQGQQFVMDTAEKIRTAALEDEPLVLDSLEVMIVWAMCVESGYPVRLDGSPREVEA